MFLSFTTHYKTAAEKENKCYVAYALNVLHKGHSPFNTRSIRLEEWHCGWTELAWQGNKRNFDLKKKKKKTEQQDTRSTQVQLLPPQSYNGGASDPRGPLPELWIIFSRISLTFALIISQLLSPWTFYKQTIMLLGF